MSRFVDRRLNGKNKSAVNRQRFIHRYKNQIKRAVSDAIAGRSITDIEKGESISIPSKDISEPNIHHGQGGRRDVVHPGNREFVPGDKVPRPESQSGKGKGNKATNKGEGVDDFVFELSKEEFMEFFFEDLELPNLTKRQLTTIYEKSRVRAGYTSDGVPSNINIVRSLTNAYARRIALRSPYKKRLKEAEAKLSEIRNLFDSTNPQIKALELEIEELKRRIKKVPFIDTFDLRYNNRIELPKPTTQAVMFCIMDVSGSMDQKKKDMAKRFFILLYLFLNRNYEKIELVFISHHTIAKEVTEEEFFYSRETGGTVVSSALKLADDVIRDRYPTNEWNIYVAQASDGDNWHDDSPLCKNILQNKILPLVQYFAYVEITPENHQSLWYEYETLTSQFAHFAMRQLETVADIYPVFRDLFKKQDKIKTT
ncbi:MAG: YeaH/YhbH family protein [Gammaproteobacteria bacterium]|nr:YeaH/YhbH family protein [Gammaproteobacteria bacterium]